MKNITNNKGGDSIMHYIKKRLISKLFSRKQKLKRKSMQFIRNTLLKIIIKRKHPHIKRQP